jgi:hypothetical protein
LSFSEELPKVNKCLIGENSPNLVALATSHKQCRDGCITMSKQLNCQSSV